MSFRCGIHENLSCQHGPCLAADSHLFPLCFLQSGFFLLNMGQATEHDNPPSEYQQTIEAAGT
jgi:hypothetical protein